MISLKLACDIILLLRKVNHSSAQLAQASFNWLYPEVATSTSLIRVFILFPSHLGPYFEA